MCLLASPFRPQVRPGQQASGTGKVTSGSHSSNICLQIREVKMGVVPASVVGWGVLVTVSVLHPGGPEKQPVQPVTWSLQSDRSRQRLARASLESYLKE